MPYLHYLRTLKHRYSPKQNMKCLPEKEVTVNACNHGIVQFSEPTVCLAYSHTEFGCKCKVVVTLYDNLNKFNGEFKSLPVPTFKSERVLNYP